MASLSINLMGNINQYLLRSKKPNRCIANRILLNLYCTNIEYFTYCLSNLIWSVKLQFSKRNRNRDHTDG